jgi:hypothetical protein
MDRDSTAGHVAAIYNAAWQVRFWRRPHQHEQKARSFLQLGLAARAAFNATEDFEPLLLAIRDALTD